MRIVASVYTIAYDQSAVTAYTDRVAAGSLIAHVIVENDLFYFLNDDETKRYGTGEYVNPVIKMKTRARIAARRHFGRGVLVA